MQISLTRTPKLYTLTRRRNINDGNFKIKEIQITTAACHINSDKFLATYASFETVSWCLLAIVCGVSTVH